MSAINYFNRGEKLRYYPGSPLIARHLLREDDKIHLTELHSSDYPLLRNEFAKDERAKYSVPMVISSLNHNYRRYRAVALC